MDRRQRKSRDAIFKAFTQLLSKKNYNSISVSEIIELADVGRTTFYAHFETKDFLLKELCEELFDHIIESALGFGKGNYHFDCKCKSNEVFVHLFHHLSENDRNILQLLSSENNEIPLKYFKSNLKKLIVTQYDIKKIANSLNLPEDFIINHLSSAFVETVSWWIGGKMAETPEKITSYYLEAVRTFSEISTD